MVVSIQEGLFKVADDDGGGFSMRESCEIPVKARKGVWWTLRKNESLEEQGERVTPKTSSPFLLCHLLHHILSRNLNVYKDSLTVSRSPTAWSQTGLKLHQSVDWSNSLPQQLLVVLCLERLLFSHPSLIKVLHPLLRSVSFAKSVGVSSLPSISISNISSSTAALRYIFAQTKKYIFYQLLSTFAQQVLLFCLFSLWMKDPLQEKSLSSHFLSRKQPFFQEKHHYHHINCKWLKHSFAKLLSIVIRSSLPLHHFFKSSPSPFYFVNTFCKRISRVCCQKHIRSVKTFYEQSSRASRDVVLDSSSCMWSPFFISLICQQGSQ